MTGSKSWTHKIYVFMWIEFSSSRRALLEIAPTKCPGDWWEKYYQKKPCWYWGVPLYYRIIYFNSARTIDYPPIIDYTIGHYSIVAAPPGNNIDPW